MMPPRLRKLVLTTHVASSVGSLGAVAGFFVLAIAGLTSRDVQFVRSAYMAMNAIAELVVVPLMLASLLIGIVASVGTRWGLFRHYWLIAKLALTILAIVVLLLQMDTIGMLARTAASASPSKADLGQQVRMVVHSAAGLVVLLVLVVLSVYKPAGITRYGLRT
jgi:hypothetical protein